MSVEGDLLRGWREFFDLSQDQLGERSGMNGAHISRYERGGPSPSVKTLVQLIDGLGILGQTPAARLARFFAGPAALALQVVKEAEGVDEYATLPVLVEVSAGHPRFAPADDDPLRLAFRRKWLYQLVGPDISPEHVFLARVRGDSMTPGIHSGDIVLVERWYPPTEDRPRRKPIEDGRVYLLQEKDGDGQTVKRLVLAGSQLTVYADNPAYRPYSVDLEDTPAHRVILGRVRWVGHKED